MLGVASAAADYVARFKHELDRIDYGELASLSDVIFDCSNVAHLYSFVVMEVLPPQLQHIGEDLGNGTIVTNVLC
jgi:hypothetical protein